eukprot:363863-Chlamydomonas_euryale.AAC.1
MRGMTAATAALPKKILDEREDCNYGKERWLKHRYRRPRPIIRPVGFRTTPALRLSVRAAKLSRNRH